VQLVVLPMALQDVLQDVTPGAGLTGVLKGFRFAVGCCQLWRV
jgi:hypothetical protein